jgi:hypothetical protein
MLKCVEVTENSNRTKHGTEFDRTEAPANVENYCPNTMRKANGIAKQPLKL